MIDIDHFKKINDQYGHAVGDLVLKSVSEIMRQDDNLVGRIGGEEFAILLKNRNLTQAKIEMEILRSNVENAIISIDDHTVSCTCSLGITRVIEGETTIEGAYLRADRALYVSKNNGRNITTVYEAE